MRHFFASTVTPSRNAFPQSGICVKSQRMSKDLTSRIISMMHGPSAGLEKGAPISPPIVSTAKYKLPGLPDTPYTYGRDINPTVEAAEAALSALEDAPCVAFPSGMAAITAALMVLTKSGDLVLLPSDGYFVTRALMSEIFEPRGVHVDLQPTRAYADMSFEGFDLVWLETPSNPGLDVCDLSACAARLKVAGAKSVVDNTTLTPFLQRPLDEGIDVVVSSDTKALAGHSDVLFGHVASRDEAVISGLKQWRSHSGSIPGPFEAFLVHRGLMSAEVRLQRMCTNADAVQRRLKAELPVLNALKQVKFPGLGFIMGLSFETAEIADRFIETCPVIFPSTSFGGVHTSAERRERWGDPVAAGYVRLSIGCEPEAALVDAVMTSLQSL